MDIGGVTSSVQTVGLAGFFWYLIRGLKAKIEGLKGVVDAQKQTIDVMERRVQETEGIGKLYKTLLSDLPSDIENYKALVSQTKDSIIVELQARTESAEQKLRRAESEIKSKIAPAEQIALHLKVLKRLISPANNRGQSHYDVARICEFNGRKLEECIPSLISSSTLDKFLSSIGYEIEVTDDSSVALKVFEDRTLPGGEEMKAGMSSKSLSGWFVVANNHIWVSPGSYSQWKDEFSSCKTVS